MSLSFERRAMSGLVLEADRNSPCGRLVSFFTPCLPGGTRTSLSDGCGSLLSGRREASKLRPLGAEARSPVIRGSLTLSVVIPKGFFEGQAVMERTQ